MKPKVVVVGCGVVGALIAYELSVQLAEEIDIHVVDGRPSAQISAPMSAAESSTGAALGVLMGIISHKVKGRTWRLREASVRRYQSLIPELKEQGYSVPFNGQGIVSLCFDEAKLLKWQTLKEKRQAQGWPLEIWSASELKQRCPQIALKNTRDSALRTVKAAIYSPADGQVHPAELAQGAIAAAQSSGVTFHWDTAVTQLQMAGQRCTSVQTNKGDLEAHWVILSAGLGSAALTQHIAENGIAEDGIAEDGTAEPLALMPVLGQAMEIQLPEILGDKTFQPVINGDDIQFVPLGEGRYWLGATVEFPTEEVPLTAESDGLKNLQAGGARFCPAIAQAKIIQTWSGLRPRPVGQPAPVIKPLGNTENITLATGHYRNGVLLAPATAQQVCELVKQADIAK
ncbi:MAG: FAD-dependent oxidoreductase [Cyanobacteria bacterium J06598_1]